MTLFNKRWLLPEGIVELLPDDAEYLEERRRRLLALFNCWGYRLVVPPVIDYLDSLLTGSGTELDLQTFKITDQLSGKLLGISADMTPQVARIDAHRLKTQAPARLCYMGTVLRTHPAGLTRTRSPFQVGAELYGHTGLESDLEMIRLMLETLNTSGFEDYYLDLGHLGIYKTLLDKSGLDTEGEQALFDILQRKAASELELFLCEQGVDNALAHGFMALIGLSGEATDTIQRARETIVHLDSAIVEALNRLDVISTRIKALFPSINIHIDLAELQGYHYQTDIVFAAYLAGHGSELARGGRYDDIGKAYDWSRPATGFSMDLNTLSMLQDRAPPCSAMIFAPYSEDKSLHKAVAQYRQAGEKVVCELPGQQGTPQDMGCNRRLVNTSGQWQIEKIG